MVVGGVDCLVEGGGTPRAYEGKDKRRKERRGHAPDVYYNHPSTMRRCGFDKLKRPGDPSDCLLVGGFSFRTTVRTAMCLQVCHRYVLAHTHKYIK